MNISESLLLFMVRILPSRVRFGNKKIAGEIGSDEAGMNYARFQFERKVKFGLGIAVTNAEVLEVGTGHGGIATFMALAGAKRVVAIDLNEQNLHYGRMFSTDLFERIGCRDAQLVFKYMNAENLDFSDQSFDIIVCDNLIEHITNVETVFREMSRVLKPGGRIVIPNFPSVYSKYGPHVKYGVGIAWVNIFFSEKTIVRVMHRIAKKDRNMYVMYPGLKNGALTFREIRRYNDFNYMTHKKFKNITRLTGFEVKDFKINRTLFGKILSRVPFFDRTILSDIFSVGTSAVLVKNK